MNQMAAYTHKQFVRAVNLSAFLGWLMVVAQLFARPSQLIPVAIAFLPITLLVCWVIVAPILRRVINKPISWFRAAFWGALIASLIAFLGIIIGRFLGWQQSINPNFSSQIGGGDYIRSVDGILTPYGWRVLVQSTVLFVLGGILSALIVRAVIGPGRVMGREEITTS